MIRSQDGNLAIPAARAMRSAQIIFASEVVFVISLALVKISILSGYHELFFVLIWYKRFVWFMIAVCILLLVTNTAGLLTMCSPIETNYDPGVKGHCRISQSVGATISTAINIAVDIILVAIPLCVVWMLNIDLAKKVEISFMFGLGLLYVKWRSYLLSLVDTLRFLTYYRIVIVAGLRIHTYGTETMSYNHRLALLSSLELHLSLIAACLPFIGPSLARTREIFLCTGLDENEFRRSKCMGPDSVEKINCHPGSVSI